MRKVRKLQMPLFCGETKPGHETVSDGFQVIRHNWNWGVHEDRPLYPYSFEEAVRKTPTWFHDNRSRYYLVTVVESGEIRYSSADKTFLLRGDKVLVIPIGTEFRFTTTRRVGYHKLSLFLLGMNLPGIAESLNLNRMELISVPDIKSIIDRMRDIDRLLLARQVEHMPEMAGKAFELLNLLAMYQRGNNRKSMLFEMARSRLGSDFQRELGIAGLAAELKISTSTIERMFRQELQMSPREYRIRKKMEYARELLLKSDLSIKEISFKLSYCNQFHFSREFLRVVGMSPSRFRNSGDGCV